MKKANIGVIVGRFQPITVEQINRVFRPALEENDTVVVILGSSDKARDPENPLTAGERQKIILAALKETLPQYAKKNILFRAARDYWYIENKFSIVVQELVSNSVKELFEKVYAIDKKLSDCNISIYGIDRNDEDSDFLKNFGWNSRVEIDEGVEAESENIMKQLYLEEDIDYNLITTSTANIMKNWRCTRVGMDISAAYVHLKKYHAKYEALEKIAGHKIQFMTVDNVVIHKSHILLVRRRSHPGKGLFALPGGFLEFDETAQAGAKRELREETRLRVKDEWLICKDFFDHPKRSLRGRTLTHAFKWEIPAWRDVPQLKPDIGFEREVTKVKWFPLSEVINDMPHLLFEDHLDIIESLAYKGRN